MRYLYRNILWSFIALMFLKSVLGLTLVFWNANSEGVPEVVNWVNWGVISLGLLSIPLVWSICFFFEFKSKKHIWTLLWSLLIIQFPLRHFLEYFLAIDLGFKTFMMQSNYPSYLYFTAPWYYHLSLAIQALMLGFSLWAGFSFYKKPVVVFNYKDHHKWSWRFSYNWVLLMLFSFTSMLTNLNSHWGSRTEGFLTTSIMGVKTYITTYTKGDKKVVLIPTIHVADSNYYSSLFSKYEKSQGIVLLEGITDKKDSFDGDFNFRKIASSAGLKTQSDIMLKHCDKEKLEELSSGAFKCGKSLEYLSGDVDFADLDPKTKTYMEVVGSSIGEGKTIVEASHDALSEIGGEQEFATVLYDIFNKREHKLAETFVKNNHKYPLVVIPWGALHAPNIDNMLVSNGYKKIEQEPVRAMSIWQFVKVVRGR